MQKKPRALGAAARGEVGGPREIATQRCDSATPSFIPPLNAKGRPKAALSLARLLLSDPTGAATTLLPRILDHRISSTFRPKPERARR
jgi:hypothetical protein